MKKFFLTCVACMFSAFVVACGVSATPTPNPLLDEVARLRAHSFSARSAMQVYKLMDGLFLAIREGESVGSWIESIGESLSPEVYEALGRWMASAADGMGETFAAPLESCFNPIVEEEEMVF